MSERTCSVRECTSAPTARGWCPMHYARWRNSGDPGTASRQRRSSGDPGTCAADNCDRPARRNGLCNSCSAKARRSGAGGCTVNDCGSRADARGLCAKHYQQVRNGLLSHPLVAEIIRDQPCSVDGCERPAYSKSFCYMHWQRNPRLGDPGEAQRRKTLYEPGQLCAIKACERPARWGLYCQSHARRFRKYGLTEQDLTGMLARQKSRCAICGSAEPGSSGEWCVDHDYITGQIRGLLCGRCNSGIGLLQDDPDIIRAAARYVARHRQMELFPGNAGRGGNLQPCAAAASPDNGGK